MNKERSKLNRNLRLELVWEAIAYSPTPVTFKDICDLTGLKRTPYLGSLVSELYARGCIESKLVRLDNGHLAQEIWAVKDIKDCPPVDPLTV